MDIVEEDVGGFGMEEETAGSASGVPLRPAEAEEHPDVPRPSRVRVEDVDDEDDRPETEGERRQAEAEEEEDRREREHEDRHWQDDVDERFWEEIEADLLAQRGHNGACSSIQSHHHTHSCHAQHIL
jgi:hypothetical protein